LLPAQIREGSRLKELRRRADRQGGTQELIDGYSREVDALLQAQNRLMLPAAGTPLESRFQAFATLMRAKESAGLEGAILSNAFSRGSFDSGVQERYQALVEAQKFQGEAFLATAPDGLKEDYRRAVAGAYAAELQGLRALGLAGRLDQDPEAWAKVAAAQLAAIKGVEDRMSLGLLNDARALERGARTRSWMLAGGCSMFGLAVLIWTWRATVLITKPIHALADGMAHLKDGDLRIQLPVHSFDETGRMTQAFNAMSARLRELARALQGHAASVASGATGLSTSAEQVSGATQQLARSSRTQREASEEVAGSVRQLQTTLVQVRASVDTMIEGGREASQQVRDTGRRAGQLMTLFDEVAQRCDAPTQSALRDGARHLEAIVQTMAQVDETLAAIEAVGGAIHTTAEEQASLSTEVNRRIRVSQAATGEVQLAAAQLANTAPEVVITAKDLVQVAQALKAAAAAFQVE
jgi:methyl-accepting chemotaxis protein